ncbi:hypothetical protein ACHAWO_007611 [Cyclotella atomus]|uniref:EF-hand domain-containing protein n=1 Tax=Cyclotella atomus TaxID=382360 RepID=A0ABD3NEU7_9STRA
MMEILTSESEFMKELKVLRPNDTTTNTVVRLKFHFIPAKKGMLKLYMHDLALADLDRGLIVRASTPDGQSKSVHLNSLTTNDSMDFWVDSKNWFGDLSIVLHQESDSDTYIQLEPSIIDFGARGRGRVSTHVHFASCMESDINISSLDVHHEFFEAGQVKIELIELSNLPSDAASNVSNLRMILRSKGKVHRNEVMTGAPMINGKLLWKDDPISMPVVDEYTLLVECCEFDDVANDHEEVGMAELSLLPLFRDGSIDTTVNLKHLTELGDALDAGVLRLRATFDPPNGVAFPQDQPYMTSYVYVRPDDREEETKTESDEQNTGALTESDIKKAFNLLDLDKNGYIGASELRHVLIFMGEHVTDEEVDMMISMLDKNGDGQVSYKEFKAMAVSDDPSRDDFLSEYQNKEVLESPTLSTDAQQRNDLSAKRMEVFARCIRACNIDTFAVARMWDILRGKAYSDPSNVTASSFYVGYDGFCELMPGFGTTSESHTLYDLIRNGASYVDGRELIMSFSNFVGFTDEDKCRLAFDMYDIDRSGFLSLEEVEALMMSTNLKTRDMIKRRAATLMASADTDQSGDICIDELLSAAERFPNLLFPRHARRKQ